MRRSLPDDAVEKPMSGEHFWQRIEWTDVVLVIVALVLLLLLTAEFWLPHVGRN